MFPNQGIWLGGKNNSKSNIEQKQNSPLWHWGVGQTFTEPSTHKNVLQYFERRFPRQ